MVRVINHCQLSPRNLLTFSVLYSLNFLGRTDLSSLCELEKRACIQSSRITIDEIERAGLTLLHPPADDPDGDARNRNLARYMLIPTAGLGRDVDTIAHCQNLITSIAVPQKKAFFVCFQAAVKNSRKEYIVCRTRVDADEDVLNNAVNNMSFADTP